MKVLTQANFKEETAKGIYVVDLYADWCGPCRLLTPILEEMDGKHDGVNFVKLDLDAAPEIQQEYGIINIPTVLFLKDGKEVSRVTGLYPPQKYLEEIKAIQAA